MAFSEYVNLKEENLRLLCNEMQHIVEVLNTLATAFKLPAAEIRDHETGLVSVPFLWFQSRQIFHETHETEEPYFTNQKYSRLLYFCYQQLTCS